MFTVPTQVVKLSDAALAGPARDRVVKSGGESTQEPFQTANMEIKRNTKGP